MIKLRIGKFRLGVCKKYLDFYFGNRVYRHSFHKRIEPDTPLQIIVKHYVGSLLTNEMKYNYSGSDDIITIGCKKTTNNKTFGNFIVIPRDKVKELIDKLIDLK